MYTIKPVSVKYEAAEETLVKHTGLQSVGHTRSANSLLFEKQRKLHVYIRTD